MASTNLYLDLRGKAKDGKGSLVIILSHNRTTTSIRTGIRVFPSEWNGERVIKRADADFLNIDLTRIKNDIDTKIALLRLDPEFSSMTAPQIKTAICQENRGKKEKHLVSSVFAEYLSQDLSDGTKGLYQATLTKVIRYAGESVCLEDLSYKWLVGFNRYLSQTRGVNGRAIDLRNLRAICNYALKTDMVQTYAFKNFPIKQEQTKKRSIPVEKLREFYRYPCSPRQSIYRDYFFLMFYLIGINAKDLFLAGKDSIVNGRLEYTRNKTKKKYSILVEPEAKELLERYRGKNYLVEVMDHCKDYHNYLHEMNDALGLIGPKYWEEVPSQEDLFGMPERILRVDPIIPDLTTYFSRHTWATFAYEIGIQMDTISQALGHSFGNKTTLIYVKPDQAKVDAANRKVIDFFLNQPSQP